MFKKERNGKKYKQGESESDHFYDKLMRLFVSGANIARGSWNIIRVLVCQCY